MARGTDRGLENREIVLDILTEVLERDGFVHIVLGRALYKYQYLEKQDRAFITRVTEGTLEYLIQLDAVINRYSKTKTERMKPLIRNLLRMSVYQLLYMDRVPDRAVCNEAVRLAQKRRFSGLKGFVNGVLRTISREKGELVFDSPSLLYSIPEWIYERWRDRWGEERAAVMAASFLKEGPTWVRCNTSLASREEIAASLEADGASAKPLEGSDCMLALSDYDSLDRLKAFQQGLVSVQDVSSALVGELAAPRAGSFIIDVCAAPGGKSLDLANRLGGTGRVEARDLTPAKVALIEEAIRRCGASNVEARVWDALTYDPASRERADLVIADLPCSGLGIIGKKPDIKYRMTPERAGELAALQREMLSVVWQYVKPGGLLIYSTCTVNPEENEQNAAWFEARFPFEPVDLSGRLEGYPWFAKLPSLERGQLQLLPGCQPFDGFFISVFRRGQAGG